MQDQVAEDGPAPLWRTQRIETSAIKTTPPVRVFAKVQSFGQASRQPSLSTFCHAAADTQAIIPRELELWEIRRRRQVRGAGVRNADYP